MREDRIELQERRVEEARRHSDKLAEDASTAWHVWEYARSLEQEAFEAFLVEKRKLNEMKG